MRKNEHFWKAGGYIDSPNLIENAVRTWSSVYFEPDHHANMRDPWKHPSVLLTGVNIGRQGFFQQRRCEWAVMARGR